MVTRGSLEFSPHEEESRRQACGVYRRRSVTQKCQERISLLQYPLGSSHSAFCRAVGRRHVRVRQPVGESVCRGELLEFTGRELRSSVRAQHVWNAVTTEKCFQSTDDHRTSGVLELLYL